MDFLNKAFAQFNDLFRSMTPGGRITAGLLLIVAVVSVGYLFQSQVTGGDDYLFSGDSISTPTLQKMQEAFGKAGLNGFTIEGGRVKVNHAQRAAYLAALADAKALPRSFGDPRREANDASPFASPKQREQQEKQVREEEMTLVINSMKGIENASVMTDTQANPGGFGQPVKTASVFAQAIGGEPLDDEQIEKIRYYVAAANAGMKPENVTIADANGRVSIGLESNGHGPNGDLYAKRVRDYEQDLATKIRKALAKQIPNVTVTATVILDHEKDSESLEVKRDPKAVPVRTLENIRNVTHDSSSTGGAPGLQPQGGGPNQPASVGGNGSKGNETSEESKSETVSEVSTTSTRKETVGLTPKSAKAWIAIPASHYEKVWLAQNPVKEGEEPKKPDQKAADIKQIADKTTQDVQKAVAQMLPVGPEVKDPTSLVTVTTYEDIKAAEIQGPPVTQRAMSWLGQNWPMLAMVGLVLFSLNVLRSLLRSVPAAESPSAALSSRVSANEAKPEEAGDSVEVTAARRLRRITGSGPSLRDELSEFVKEDPDSAANIIRTWIGQVT
jgi:flagellar M-ring protein FliF